MVSLVTSLVIAFVNSWVMTLVVLSPIPLVVLGGAVDVIILSGHTKANRKCVEATGKVGNYRSGLYLSLVLIR